MGALPLDPSRGFFIKRRIDISLTVKEYCGTVLRNTPLIVANVLWRELFAVRFPAIHGTTPGKNQEEKR
jgi:hypothetical protein